MKFAYADPPYIGQAKRHYSHDPLCAEVNHAELIARLMEDYPDGWALSASSPSLGQIMPLLPKGYRIGIWCKNFCAFKRNVRPAFAWEPVIFWGGRNPMNGHRAIIPEKNGKQTTPKDFVEESVVQPFRTWLSSLLQTWPKGEERNNRYVCGFNDAVRLILEQDFWLNGVSDRIVCPITLQKGLVGAKPEKVCRWILELLNAQVGDTVDDLFPGTGIMGRVASALGTEVEKGKS